MRVTIFIYFIFLVLSSSIAHSLEISGFRLQGAHSDVSVIDNVNLSKILGDELKEQRSNNRQLKLYKTRQKISRFESSLLNKRLRAEGYYSAVINIEDLDGKTHYRIDSGPIYRIEEVIFELPAEVTLPEELSLMIAADAPLIAHNVIEAHKNISNYISKNYCFYRVEVDYSADVYHESHTAKITFSMKPSEQVNFGEIDIQGLSSVDAFYLKIAYPLRQAIVLRKSLLIALEFL